MILAVKLVTCNIINNKGRTMFRVCQGDVDPAFYYPPFSISPSESSFEYSPHGGKEALKRLNSLACLPVGLCNY
jgi:hypothetical protein